MAACAWGGREDHNLMHIVTLNALNLACACRYPGPAPSPAAATEPDKPAPAFLDGQAKCLLMHYMPWYEAPAVRG